MMSPCVSYFCCAAEVVTGFAFLGELRSTIKQDRSLGVMQQSLDEIRKTLAGAHSRVDH